MGIGGDWWLRMEWEGVEMDRRVWGGEGGWDDGRGKRGDVSLIFTG